MLKNNIEMDVKMRCIEKSTTQAKIAENSGCVRMGDESEGMTVPVGY